MNGNGTNLEMKITAPITWDSNSKFKIQDLRENHYEEVIALIKKHYFREEPMCRSIGIIRDPDSVKGYLDLIKTWMKDTTSLVAVSEKSGRVIGAVITRLNSFSDRMNTYSRVQLFEGEALDTIMQLKSALIKQANVYEAVECATYLRVYIITVHPSYKSKGVGNALLEACSEFAFNLKIPVIGGIFTSNEYQLIAGNVGFSSLTEIPYNNWIIDDEVVFDDPGIGNYSAAFMFLKTPDEESLKNKRKMKAKERKLEKKAKK